jgi:hypothetical protein
MIPSDVKRVVVGISGASGYLWRTPTRASEAAWHHIASGHDTVGPSHACARASPQNRRRASPRRSIESRTLVHPHQADHFAR